MAHRDKWSASAAGRGDTATVPIPIDGKDPMVGYDRDELPRGILLIREVYDYRGRKVVLE